MGDQNGLLRDEEEASQDMQGICNERPHHFMTILDNILNLGESAGGEEEPAGLTHTNEACYMEREGEQKMARQWTLLRCSGSRKRAAKHFVDIARPYAEKS
jgi:hypothetical protein